MTLADPSYEDRKREDEHRQLSDFDFSLERMNVSGPLFDFVKLQSINNNYLSALSTQELYDQGLKRAQQYQPALAQLMRMLNTLLLHWISRDTPKKIQRDLLSIAILRRILNSFTIVNGKL